MEDIHRLFEYFSKPTKKVLATIIGVTGSAYKKEGSAMLFLEDGTQVGTVSAGCLEADLALKAKEVMKTWKMMTIQYDMREATELAWGLGTGCNGIIDILLEPITDQLKRDFSTLKQLLDFNIPVLFLKKLEMDGEYIFIPKLGKPFGNWKGKIPVGFAEVQSGMLAELPIFQHLFQPKPRLICFGAGPDAIPLVAFAAATGFSVSVVDWREAYCQKKNFQTADKIIVAFPKEAFHQIKFTADDFVVIMTHHFQRDQEILLTLLQKELKYLGILGPRDRTRRLLQGGSIPIHIHSPVGFSIGAKGPEEIAISILAEMIQIHRQPVIDCMEHVWSITE
ncbi:XdhC family protein [Neobacillus massiliamazoniensis]|uniref:Xanthine dehydrogenase, molybdopterin recruitment factor n=1 Tax=Neobacillus massiliamazoniensis TaxID=1499688 RepID=A0A0U1NTE7_9BACI|nr:XdhC family protein [Neobacillus massiliamazoniensis]CRK81012.1 xanthine dehydrogenase, molybdopterin recruitment factor [Neobacillus massiliamazoniensis]